MADTPKFIDMNTLASLPGRIPVNLKIWQRCFPAKVFLPRGIIAVVFLPFIFFIIQWVSTLEIILTVGAALTLAGLVARWQITRIREHFAHGCLNPAKVISTHPYLIAVSSDLTKTHGDPWPAIKILPQPLARTGGRRPQVGDYIATVALYYGFIGDNQKHDNQKHWLDFDPIAVNCVTDDPSVIENAVRRLHEYPEEDVWGDLEKYLALVPKPYRPGLYWMREK